MDVLTSVFSQQIMVPKLTSPHTQYLGSSGSMYSPAASSSAFAASSFSFALAAPSAAFFALAAEALPRFLGAFFRLPTLTAGPSS